MTRTRLKDMYFFNAWVKAFEGSCKSVGCNRCCVNVTMLPPMIDSNCRLKPDIRNSLDYPRVYVNDDRICSHYRLGLCSANDDKPLDCICYPINPMGSKMIISLKCPLTNNFVNNWMDGDVNAKYVVLYKGIQV